jgi:hypothetical protein
VKVVGPPRLFILNVVALILGVKQPGVNTKPAVVVIRVYVHAPCTSSGHLTEEKIIFLLNFEVSCFFMHLLLSIT